MRTIAVGRNWEPRRRGETLVVRIHLTHEFLWTRATSQSPEIRKLCGLQTPMGTLQWALCSTFANPKLPSLLPPPPLSPQAPKLSGTYCNHLLSLPFQLPKVLQGTMPQNAAPGWLLQGTSRHLPGARSGRR